MTKAEADKMFMDHIGLAEKITMRWVKNIGRKYENDLRSSSYYGLCLAIKYFDESRGNKFTTYAWHTIVSKVREEARFLTNIKKVQVNKKREFVKIKEAEREMHRQGKVYFPCKNGHVDNKEVVEQILSKIKSPRNRDMFKLRYCNEATFDEIGKIYGVSRQRVEQITKEIYNRFSCSPVTKEELI